MPLFVVLYISYFRCTELYTLSLCIGLYISVDVMFAKLSVSFAYEFSVFFYTTKYALFLLILDH